MDGYVDFLREGLRVPVGGVIGSKVSAQNGAHHGERNPHFITHRNGYPGRDWDTRADAVELRIPKTR